jgi:WD40 repeat protein
VLTLQVKRMSLPVRWLAFAPDGLRLASISGHRLRLWPLTPPGPPTVAPPPDPVEHAAFAPDGSWLVLLHRTRVSRWRIGEKKEEPRLFATDVTSRVEVTRDGRHVITVGDSGAALFDLEARQRRWLWREAHTESESLALSRDGALLATGLTRYRPADRDFFVRLDRLSDGGQARRLEGPGNTITSLALAPDDRCLAAACGQFLWAWDVTTGAALFTEKIDARHYSQVVFTPDGRFLAAVRNDASVRFHDARTWRQVAAFDWELGPLTSLALAPDGMRAAAGSKGGKIVVWDVDL